MKTTTAAGEQALTTTTMALATMAIGETKTTATTTTTSAVASGVVTTVAAPSFHLASMREAASGAVDAAAAVVAATVGLRPKVVVSPPKRMVTTKTKVSTAKGKAGAGGRGAAAAGMGLGWQRMTPTQRSMVHAHCRLISFHFLPHPDYPEMYAVRMVSPEGPDAHYIIENIRDYEKVKEGLTGTLCCKSPMFFARDEQLQENLMRWLKEPGEMVCGWSMFDERSMVAPRWPTMDGCEGSPWSPSDVVAKLRCEMVANGKKEEPELWVKEDLVMKLR